MNSTAPERNTPGRAAALYAALLILAGLASYILWAFATIMARYVAYKNPGIPLPNLTQFLFDHRILLRFFPIPWLLFAIHSVIRGKRTTYQLLSFSSTLILALLLLVIIVALALTMPWMSIIAPHPAFELEYFRTHGN